jgi:hypothetical protein
MSHVILGRPCPHSNTPSNCPDLRALCAGRWRVSRDPVAAPGDLSPHAQILVGRFGEVYPHDRGRLIVEVYDGAIALLIAGALGGRLPWQRGAGAFAYIFPADDLEAVARVIQPRRVRHLPQPAPGHQGGPRSPNGRPERHSGPETAARPWRSRFRKLDVGKGKRLWDQGDCQARALTVAAGLHYDEAWELLYRLQGKHRTHGFLLQEYLERDPAELGVVRKISFPARRGVPRTTVAEFCLLCPAGSFILQVANHMVAVEDGHYFDRWDCGRRCVYRAWEVRDLGAARRNGAVREAGATAAPANHCSPVGGDHEGR